MAIKVHDLQIGDRKFRISSLPGGDASRMFLKTQDTILTAVGLFSDSAPGAEVAQAFQSKLVQSGGYDYYIGSFFKHTSIELDGRWKPLAPIWEDELSGEMDVIFALLLAHLVHNFGSLKKGMAHVEEVGSQMGFDLSSVIASTGLFGDSLSASESSAA